MSKYSILYMHKSTLKILLKQRSKFWKIEDFEGDIRQDCEQRMKTALMVTKCYLGYSLSVVASFLIQPIVTGQLPVFIYEPQGWYYFLFFSFFLITPAIMASIWGVDTIFYSVSAPVSIQLKLLAHKFQTTKFDNPDGEIKKTLASLVDYHNFLISYVFICAIQRNNGKF